MSAYTDYLLLLQSKGQSLAGLGLSEMGLEREGAIEATRLLQCASRSILGGDVYFKKKDSIEVAYANWHVEPRSGESAFEFVQRSCEEARHYIERFPSGPLTPLFVFVVS